MSVQIRKCFGASMICSITKPAIFSCLLCFTVGSLQMARGENEDNSSAEAFEKGSLRWAFRETFIIFSFLWSISLLEIL